MNMQPDAWSPPGDVLEPLELVIRASPNPNDHLGGFCSLCRGSGKGEGVLMHRKTNPVPFNWICADCADRIAVARGWNT